MNVSVKSVAMLLIVIATACAAGRLFSSQKLNEPSLARDPSNPDDRRPDWSPKRPRPMPTFSSNDRARWATVRSLVEEGTYVVGKREVDEQGKFKDSGIIFEDGWQSIDKVLHPETQEFYSSKPPLLSTLVAGLYWVFFHLFGLKLDTHPFTVVRAILVLINIVPFFIYLWVLDRWAGYFAKEGWTRLVIVAAGGFATTVTPFLITFNNHTLGTFAVLFSIDGVLAIVAARRATGGSSARANPPSQAITTTDQRDSTASAVARADKPPVARSWLPLRFIEAGFFAAFAVTNELPALAFAAAILALLTWIDWKQTLLFALPPALLVVAAFFGTNYLAVGQLRPAYSEFGSKWYEYEGSYWKKPAEGEMKYGIDWAWMHESRATYAIHVLVGHHGLFSLTPLWLLAVGGMFVGWKQTTTEQSTLPRWLPGLTLALTVVVVGFYLFKSDNYGGWTNGLRWLMWLSPLWLLTMIPIVDRLTCCCGGRAFVYLLLAISVVSASYSPWNPWRHPWLYDFMLAYGWPGYGR